MSSGQLSRRSFLGAAAGASLAAGQVLQAQSGRSSSAGANEKLGIGFIGAGGRGRYLMDRFAEADNAQTVAVCDVHAKRLEEGRAKAGDQAKAYHDYRDLLADKRVDAVVVATNGHWHVLPAIDACKAGKDVYLEKPVGTSIGEGRALIEVANKTGKIVYMGTQQRSWPHYQEAVEIIRSGELGEISLVEVFDLENFYPGFGSPADCAPPEPLDWDFWLGPAPKVQFNPNRFRYHYWFFDYGGGWQLDWAVHHYDIVHWAMDVSAPINAVGAGSKLAFADSNTQWPDTFTGACEYAPGPVARNGFQLQYTYRGGCQRPIEGKTHGKVFYGTNGTLALDRYDYRIFSEHRNGKQVIKERRNSSIPEHQVVLRHVNRFVENVRQQKPSEVGIELGHQASNPGHLMNIAWRVGRKINWDAKAERVIDDAEANKLVTRDYRDPWELR